MKHLVQTILDAGHDCTSGQSPHGGRCLAVSPRFNVGELVADLVSCAMAHVRQDEAIQAGAGSYVLTTLDGALRGMRVGGTTAEPIVYFTTVTYVEQ
jgi:hypothetical protein